MGLICSRSRQISRLTAWVSQSAEETVLSDVCSANYQQVIATIYRYIALLRSQPPQEYVFDDVKALSEIGFRFIEPAPGSAYTSELAKKMQQPVPREKIVSSQWLVERFDAEAIKEALQLLDIGRGNVAVTAKVMPPGVGPLDQAEPFYGTRYRRDKLPVQIVAAVSPLDCGCVALLIRLPRLKRKHRFPSYS